MDDFVTAVVIGRLARPDAHTLMRARDTVDTAGIRQEAQAARERLDSLAVDFADGVLTAQQVRTATERLRAKIAAYERQLADAGRVDVLSPLLTGTDVRKAWDALSIDRQRTVVATLLHVKLFPPGRGTRTFRPETIGLEWAS